VLDDAVHRCDTDGSALAVIYLGLDNFRMVNEAYGHATGDRLLAQVPARLRQAVPDAIGITRNAGDEFILALPGGRDQARSRPPGCARRCAATSASTARTWRWTCRWASRCTRSTARGRG
jgi:GGDEF domain-containing protein